MSDFEKFKQMDDEEIFKKTFIAPKNIRNLKEENFKRLGSKSRALGFISIIERQLGLNLDELRQKVEEYFGDRLDYQNAFEIHERVVEKKRLPIWQIMLVLLVGAGGYYWYNSTEQETVQNASPKEFFSSSSISSSISSSVSSVVTSSSAIAVAEASSSQVQSSEQEQETTTDQSASQEENLSVANEQNASSSISSEAILPKVTIIPKRKLWIGIIYLDNFKRKNYITSSPVELNTSRDQLIVTGHGKLQIDSDGEIEDFNSTKKMRFIYRAGVLEVIDRNTFKLHNRGKDW